MSEATQPITGLPVSGLPRRALVVGDPNRVLAVGELLTGVRELADRREYRSLAGTWNGEEIVVASHGVGGPGAICLFQELADGGVQDFLRLGTTGALQPGIDDGDLVIAEACVRDDGVTTQLIPDTYPAYSSPEAVIALQRAAQRHEARFHRGVVWTRAAFYPDIVDLGLPGYQRAGVLAIEMELSALLVFAARNGLRAGGVLVVDGAAADELRESTGYDPHRDVVARGIRAGMTVALDALTEG